MSLCNCGCGKEVTKEGNKFVNGHNIRGKKRGPLTEDRRKNISKSKIGKKHTKEWNENISKGHRGKRNPHTKEQDRKHSEQMKGRPGYWKGKKLSIVAREKQRIAKEGKRRIGYNPEPQRQWMLNGGASYLNSCNKSPSKPQVEIWKNLVRIFGFVIFNAPFYRGSEKRSYCLDTLVPMINLVVEYDGGYWHPDEEYDKKRQQEIEEEGYMIMKYKGTIKKDIIPTEERMKRDIQNLLENKLEK